MVTVEITGMAGNIRTGAYTGLGRQDKAQRQAPPTIARYQTGRGITALVVVLMDLLVRFDPR